MSSAECLRVYVLSGKTDRLLYTSSREDDNRSADACNRTGWSWRNHRQSGKKGMHVLLGVKCISRTSALRQGHVWFKEWQAANKEEGEENVGWDQRRERGRLCVKPLERQLFRIPKEPEARFEWGHCLTRDHWRQEWKWRPLERNQNITHGSRWPPGDSCLRFEGTVACLEEKGTMIGWQSCPSWRKTQQLDKTLESLPPGREWVWFYLAVCIKLESYLHVWQGDCIPTSGSQRVDGLVGFRLTCPASILSSNGHRTLPLGTALSIAPDSQDEVMILEIWYAGVLGTRFV